MIAYAQWVFDPKEDPVPVTVFRTSGTQAMIVRKELERGGLPIWVEQSTLIDLVEKLHRYFPDEPEFSNLTEEQQHLKLLRLRALRVTEREEGLKTKAKAKTPRAKGTRKKAVTKASLFDALVAKQVQLEALEGQIKGAK